MDARWTWERLRSHAPAHVVRRAMDHLVLQRVDLHERNRHLAGRVAQFDVGVSVMDGQGSCSCGQPLPCAHSVALLILTAGLPPGQAPHDLRSAPRAAFAEGDPPAPVPAFPESGSDVEVPADVLTESQRAALEAVPGVVRKSASAYTVPRSHLLELAGALEAQGTGLVTYPRRPFVRFRASCRRGDEMVRLVATETPGLGVRKILEKRGFRSVRKPKSLVHEYLGPAAELHLAAEEMAQQATAVVLAEGQPPSFEPLELPAHAPPTQQQEAAARDARPKALPVPIAFSRQRFEWWTPRRGLQPLQAAILQRHAIGHRGDRLVFSNESLRAAERELIAAGQHSVRVEEAPAVPAEASPGAQDGEASLEVKVRPLPPRIADVVREHGFATAGPSRAGVRLTGPSANLPALSVALAQVGVHLVAGEDGWPPAPPEAPTPRALFPDDPRIPLAREGILRTREEDGKVTLDVSPEVAMLPRNLRVELYRLGWLASDGSVAADPADAGRLVALLRERGFDAKWPRPKSPDWRLASVRYSERPRRDGGGTLLHLKGPIALGRMGGLDPSAEAARIASIVRAMEASLKRHHPDARPVAQGAMPGLWSVQGGPGAFLLEAAERGASVTPAGALGALPLGKGVVLVDTTCLPPRLTEFRRSAQEDVLPRHPVVTPEIDAVVRRVVREDLEVDRERGHYLVPSTRMGDVIEALRELGAKVLHRRLAPKGKRYARWEPYLPEDETGERPKLREPFRGIYEGDVPGLREETVLDPHQREALAFILHHKHSCLLADEMGLGKTLTSIASAQFLPGRVLVVCPASARGVWRQEVHAWTTEESRILLPGDSPSQFLENDAGEKYVVVAYSGLSRFADALHEIPFDLVILDESHYVKSRAAQRTRLVEEKLRRIPRRLILSGTPVMNEPREIRTQLAFVHPDEWSDTAWFNRRFQRPWKHGTPEVRDAVLKRLREYLEGVMLRREKRQALPDLPEKHLHVHRLALPDGARRAYDEQEDSFRDYLRDNEETALTANMARTAGRLERLKQTALIGKLPAILTQVREKLDAGEKVVVFSHYREPIRAMAKELAPYGVVTLTGATRAAERGDLVKRFQDEDDVRVFIGQTVAAGIAVTLTAARHAVFTDLEWNPALHRQAMDRIHRKTQTRDVEVHFFLASDTVEEDVAEVLEEKAEMMEQLLEGRKGGTFGLRDREAAQREVALRILSRRRRLAVTADEDDD